MSAPQIVHVEEVTLGARIYAIAVMRVAGGLVGQWHCSCGEAHALSQAHVALADALAATKRDLERHDATVHAGDAQA